MVPIVLWAAGVQVEGDGDEYFARMKSDNHDNVRFKDFRKFIKRRQCELTSAKYSESDDSSEKAEEDYNDGDAPIYVASGVEGVSIDGEPAEQYE